ncbi:MAG: MTH1187 family thiamine-binding protein [Methanothrix sp.]|nr:MTH1187 family thiamine-binding protein [Methanothrix sp.]
MIVADFSMIPMGSGTSASRYVKAVHEVLKSSGINFVPGSMSTSVEVKSLQELFRVIDAANERLKDMGVQRIITNIRIDCRLDKEISIRSNLGVVGP